MCICRTWLKHHTCSVCIACMVNMEACRGTRGTWQVVIFYNLRYEVHVVCTRWHSPYPEHFPYPNTYPWATAQRWSDNRCSTVYSIQHTVYSIQYTVYSIQYTVYSIQYTAFSIQHTVYSIQYTAYSIQHTVYLKCIKSVLHVNCIILEKRAFWHTSSCTCMYVWACVRGVYPRYKLLQ